MTIEYPECRADLIFKLDFGWNGAIGTVATWWDLILFGKYNNFHRLHNFSQMPQPFIVFAVSTTLETPNCGTFSKVVHPLEMLSYFLIVYIHIINIQIINNVPYR